MAKFNPTIKAYLDSYTTEGYDNKKLCHWASLLLKVERIGYTMGTCALSDIYTLALGKVCIYQTNHSITYKYTKKLGIFS